MSHPELIERPDRLEVHSPMRAGMRVFLALIALFPLLAPYELILRVDWREYVSPFFLFAALISAGAIALSAILLFAAIAGLSSAMVFDKRSKTFTYSATSPVIRLSQTRSLSAIHEVGVGVHDWSDGAPTHSLRVTLADGTAFESGSSTSRDGIDLIRDRIGRFLA